MKVGILTFHNGYNYGAFLQCFCLSHYLADCGHDVEVIHYRSFRHTFQEFAALRGKRPTRIIGNLSKVLKWPRCMATLPLSKRVYTHSGLSQLTYDVVVYGSDSVWNHSSHIIGFDEAYFGGIAKAAKHISYAASMGPDSDPATCPDRLAGLLSRLDAASVRDKNTQQMYSMLTGKQARLVLDPTFLWSLREHCITPRQRDYIAVYGGHFPAPQRDSILRLSQSAGLPIVSIGYFNAWADENRVGLDPFEWVGYLLSARKVVTNMYHGTLLAIQNRKPFAVYYDVYRSNKIAHSTELLGLANRASDTPVDLQSLFETPIDWALVEAKIQHHRKQSIDYLQQELTRSND